MQFIWEIPNFEGNGESISLELCHGHTIFIVGANGSGKSALITQLSKAATNIKTLRIAAHRQSWFESNSIDITARNRESLQRNITTRDRQDVSRWKDDIAGQRLQAVLFDLANAENTVSRAAYDLLKQGNADGAMEVARTPSPLETMNTILTMSTLTLALSIDDKGNILAQHGDGPSFGISQLSDGERNAVLLAAQILTAEPDTLILVDEPERHLHRSITEPMLSALFKKRADCSFVISTHEPELPASSPESSVVIVRQCSWNGEVATGWDVDVLAPGVEVTDDVRYALLGSRRRLLFIEGETQSLDYPLMSTLFPGLSIKPMGSCREVERMVTGLTGTRELHWLQPIGLVDRDDRTANDVEALMAKNIFPLEVSSIESVFYSSDAIIAMSTLQAEVYGLQADDLYESAIEAGLNSLDDDTKRSLAARRAERSARNSVLRVRFKSL